VNCDRIARWYRWLEYAAFGGELERRRSRFLPEVADFRRALVLGDGDGRFLAKLTEQRRDAAIDYLDLSQRMLALARKRAASGGQVTFHHADALAAPLLQSEYDLIVTHFFLDCFDPPAASALISRVAAAAQPKACWLVSEFHQPPSGWPSIWASLWLRLLYLFFRVTTGLRTRRLVDHHPLLGREGFRLARRESAWFGLLASELWVRSL
jgi:ubiquinone/menaquinone biosynthesis C-methylase UbiE